MNPGSRLPSNLWPLLLLLVSLGISALLWHNAERQVEHELQSTFEQRALGVRERIKNSLATQDQHLHSLAGLFHASPRVAQEDFHKYFESVQPPGQEPNFAAMVYLQHIPAQRATDFRTAIRFIEPMTAVNQKIIGFDSASVPAMRAGMQYAREHAGVGMSPPVTLRQDAGKAVPGFVLYLPVYLGAHLHRAPVAQRAEAVSGWVGMSFRIAPLMDQLLAPDLKDMDLHLYEGQRASADTLLYDSSPEQERGDLTLHLQDTQQLDFGGQKWTLVLHARPAFVPATAHHVPRLTAAVGALLSLLLTYALLYLQRRDRQRVASIEKKATEAQERAHEAQRLQTMKELQDSEQEARQSEARARHALAQLEMQRYALDQHAIVAHTDVQGRITYVNDKFCQISGYGRDELLGQDHLMLNSGVHAKGFFKAMYRVLASGKTWHGEVCNRAKDGRLYWLRTTVTPFPGPDGKPASYVAIRADITQSRLAERKLAEREAIYRNIVTQAREGIALIDPASQRFIEFNNAYCKSLGYGREEFENLSLSAIQGDLDPAALTQRLQSEVTTGHASFDTQYRRKNGELFSVHVSSRRIYMAGATYLVAVVSDNSDRLQAQQAQEEARKFLLQIVAQVPGCVFQARLTPQRGFSFPFASDGLFELLGLYPQAVQDDATPALRLTLPEERSGLIQSLHQSARDLTPWQQEFRVQLTDGPMRWLAGNAVPQRAPDGAVVWHGFITDISSRKQAEVELVQYRDNLEELVQQKTAELSASAAATRLALNQLKQQKFVLDQHAIVSICDIDGRITYGNDKFAEISGYSREEFLGQDHQLSRSGHHPKGFFKEMYEVIAQGGVWHAEVCNRAKDGSLYWVDSTVAAFMGKDGQAQEYIAVRTDITKRKRIEELTRQAEEVANAANRSKSEFLANMSHEIRTPMNGVIGMVDILQQTALQPAQARMLATIHKSSLALLSILNDILDFSKIEAGKLEVECIPTHVREVVEGVAQTMLSVADSKQAQVSVFVDPALPDWVLSDPTRLRQILFNLLSNALKFIATEQGHVMLHVYPVLRPDGCPCLQFCVMDNGIGMSEDVVGKLFQPFSQADASTARTFGGTGLGLSITQRLVAMMGGSIAVHSRVAVGSEFTVEFPLQIAQTPAGRTLAVRPDLAGVQVLAVTDSSPCATLLQVYLSSAGAQVHLVPDLPTAQHYLAQHQPANVLLLDLAQSPAAAGGWQHLDWPQDLRTVQLVLRDATALGDKDAQLSANPLLYHELLHSVAIAAGRLAAPELPTRSQQRSLPQAPAALPQPPGKGPLILVAEDNATNREVIVEQLKLLGYAAEMAHDGVTALQMWRDGLATQPGQSDRFSLLLTDCHMPHMDGFELTAHIRLAQQHHLPIVAITANAMQGEAQRCRERGMDDYLPKPLRLNELAAMLSKWLPAQLPATRPLDLATPQAAPALAVWNPLTLSELMGDNPVVHARLLRKFLTLAQTHVTSMLGAVSADHVDLKILATQAHTLKSSARSVGALVLGELCQALESAAGAADAAAHCRGLAAGLADALAAATEQIAAHLEQQAAAQPEAP